MALTNLVGGFEFPPLARLTQALNTSTFVLDASGEVAVVIFRPSKSGNLTRFEAYVSAIGNTPDNGLRFSFQDVSATTGLQDGVVDQSATIASGSLGTGWQNPGDFDTARAVTPASVVAAVIDFPSFVASDSVTIGAFTSANTNVSLGFPYAISATNTKNSLGNIPCIAVRYDDGTYDVIQGTGAYSAAIGSFSMSSSTTPDEFGNAFTLAVPIRVNRLLFSAGISGGANFDIVIYNAANGVVASGSSDGDITSASSGRVHEIALTSAADLSASTLYRAIIKPTTTTTSTFYYSVHPSLALMDTLPGGQVMYATQRVDAGSWTDFQNGTDGFRRAMLVLGVNGIDNAVSTGGINRAAFPSGLSSLG